MPLAPLPCPQIQHVVKIDIRQQWRYSAGNNRANSRINWGLRIARESFAPRYAGCPDVEIVLVTSVMSRKPRIWHIRLAFEPNRFSCEPLERVYEQLKPTDARGSSELTQPQSSVTKHRAAKRGEQ